MAALPGGGTTTIEARSSSVSGPTSNRPEAVETADNDVMDTPAKTSQAVSRKERGNPSEKDSFADRLLRAESGDRVRFARSERKKVSNELCDTLSKAITNIGSIKLASNLQTLRKQLANAHKTLGEFPSEADFMSIVVLVEFCLGDRKWKEWTKVEFQSLKAALEVGKQENVTFDDYNKAFRTFAASGWSTGPTTDFIEFLGPLTGASEAFDD